MDDVTYFDTREGAVAERRFRGAGWLVVPHGERWVLRRPTDEDKARCAAEEVSVTFNTRIDLHVGDFDEQDCRQFAEFVAEVAAEQRRRAAAA